MGMLKRIVKNLSLLLMLCLNMGIGLSHADVLVDMAQNDEIIISNTQENIAYTFKIEEQNEAIVIAGVGENIQLNNEPTNYQANISETLLESTVDNTIIVSNNYNQPQDKLANNTEEASNKKVGNLVKNLPFNKEVQFAAKVTSVAPALIHAVISAESNHNPHARSAKGAYGLMQIMPSTAKFYKVSDRNDPKQNILAGAKLLKDLLKVFNGDIKLSLAAYNAGLPAVLKHKRKIPPYQETQRYVPKVMGLYKKFT